MAGTENKYAGLSVLVAGLGSIGLRHLENFRSLGVGRLGALRRRGKELHRPADLSGVALHHDLDQALSENWDAVVVATPSALHLDTALPAARAGCHLYLEKPVSHTMAGVEELSQEVARRELVAAVGCQLRCEPGLELVKQWLDEKRIGRVVSAACQAGEWLPGWHPWEDYRNSYAARFDLGGGVVLTTIHEIDYLQWLLGPLELKAATGGVSGELEISAEDHAAALLDAGGAGVLLSLDYLRRPPVRRLSLTGTRGHIEWDYMAGRAELWVEGELAGEFRRPAQWERNDMFLALARDFLDAILEGRPPRVPLSEGVAALRTALAIKSAINPR